MTERDKKPEDLELQDQKSEVAINPYTHGGKTNRPEDEGVEGIQTGMKAAAELIDNLLLIAEESNSVLSPEQIKTAGAYNTILQLATVAVEATQAESRTEMVNIMGKGAAGMAIPAVVGKIATAAEYSNPASAALAWTAGLAYNVYVEEVGEKLEKAQLEQQSRFIVDRVNTWNIPLDMLKSADDLHSMIDSYSRLGRNITFEDMVKQTPIIEAAPQNGLSEEENIRLAEHLEKYATQSPLAQLGVVPYLIKTDPQIYDKLVANKIIPSDKTGYKYWRGKIMPGNKADELARQEPYDIQRAYELMEKELRSGDIKGVEDNASELLSRMEKIWYENVGDDSEFERMHYFDQPIAGRRGEVTAADYYRAYIGLKREQHSKELKEKNQEDRLIPESKKVTEGPFMSNAPQNISRLDRGGYDELAMNIALNAGSPFRG